MKYTDPTGHMQVCERGDEGIEGKLHTSRCGSGANMDQIAKAFDKRHRGKGYSEYYKHIHAVAQELDLYLENINIEYEKETDAMRDKRITYYENRLKAVVGIARQTGATVHLTLSQDVWKDKTKFPEILGGGYIAGSGDGSLGGDGVPGSGEFSSFSISDIVNYYTRTVTRTPPTLLVFPGKR